MKGEVTRKRNGLEPIVRHFGELESCPISVIYESPRTWVLAKSSDNPLGANVYKGEPISKAQQGSEGTVKRREMSSASAVNQDAIVGNSWFRVMQGVLNAMDGGRGQWFGSCERDSA
jgi:hypothetical protein